MVTDFNDVNVPAQTANLGELESLRARQFNKVFLAFWLHDA
jgi:hypothetical protein